MSEFVSQIVNLLIFSVLGFYLIMFLVFAADISSKKRKHRNEERARQDYYSRQERWRNERK